MKLDALSCCVQSSQDRANADKLLKQFLSEGKKAGRTHIQSKTPAPPGVCQSTGHDPRLRRRPGFCIIVFAKHLALLWPPFSGSSKPPGSLFLLARWCGIFRSEQVPGLLCDSSTPWQPAAPRSTASVSTTSRSWRWGVRSVIPTFYAAYLDSFFWHSL